ncbi:MAG TPA: hypothetical protein PKL82_01320 [Anaerolineaceae bacterium]|jgi:hypothetical protein|nr:hypothetical protein [Anaerolineaceae bacterium]NMD27032.1 hypothetical protein [Chloroflexota bacterium]HOA21112.1 hypothetical protein [Anaerolineaceae bacterium]HOG77090.1 hypothetical protein [Anaerolineaceae bacterium]
MNPRSEAAANSRNWIARALIAVVLGLNLQAAISYLLNPQAYSAFFELNGVPGSAAVAGVGILYLMWQVPYVFALSNPMLRKTSLIEATIMQTIGLIGETWLLGRINDSYLVLRSSIIRYIIFDAAGLALLAAAYCAANCRLSHSRKGDENV